MPVYLWLANGVFIGTNHILWGRRVACPDRDAYGYWVKKAAYFNLYIEVSEHFVLRIFIVELEGLIVLIPLWGGYNKKS